MNVFISWSGDRGKVLAVALYDWLRRVIQPLKPWMSDESIPKGSQWTTELAKGLKEHDVGILCVTPESQEAPWLLFEAGALSKALDKARVYPILLGMDISELEGPLSQFQGTRFEKDDIFKLLKDLNGRLGTSALDLDVLKDAFERHWNELEQRVQWETAKITVLLDRASVKSVITTLTHHGYSTPLVGRCMHVSAGFESHSLYGAILPIVKRRLYIFGRKNRKLFDKEYRAFFSGLPDRLRNGFDFKCLFLDPSAPNSVISAAHRSSTFLEELNLSIEHATTVMREIGVDATDVFRFYSIHRPYALLVADDAVCVSPSKLGKDGKTEPYTNSPFSLCDAISPCGKNLIDVFLSFWNIGAKPPDIQ